MTVFNEKYTKIINLATNKDEELKQVLTLMLNNLTEEEKQNCYEGKKFVNDSRTIYLTNLQAKESNTDNDSLKTDVSILSVEEGRILYTLSIADLTDKSIDKLKELEKVQLFTLDVFIIKPEDNENVNDSGYLDVDYSKCYTLELTKKNGKYVLLYYVSTAARRNIIVDHNEQEIKITEEELKDITNADCALSFRF